MAILLSQSRAWPPIAVVLLLSMSARGHCAKRLLNATGNIFNATSKPVDLTLNCYALMESSTPRDPETSAPMNTSEPYRCTQVDASPCTAGAKACKPCTFLRMSYYVLAQNGSTSTLNEAVETQKGGCGVRLWTNLAQCRTICTQRGVKLPAAASNSSVSCMTGCVNGTLAASYNYRPREGTAMERGTCVVKSPKQGACNPFGVVLRPPPMKLEPPPEPEWAAPPEDPIFQFPTTPGFDSGTWPLAPPAILFPIVVPSSPPYVYYPHYLPVRLIIIVSVCSVLVGLCCLGVCVGLCLRACGFGRETTAKDEGSDKDEDCSSSEDSDESERSQHHASDSTSPTHAMPASHPRTYEV